MLKLSDIKNMVQRRIIIENGTPKWKEISTIDGEIVFTSLTKESIEKINSEVVQKLQGNETEQEVAYKMMPYLVDIESDVSLDEFIDLMEVRNPIILMLYEGLIENINNLLEYAENVGRVQEKENNVLTKIQIEETIEEKIIRLTKEMEKETDTKKKKILLLELAKLYEKVDNNG